MFCMSDYKRIPVYFKVSKAEDRVIYDALMQYPAGVRSHVVRCALSSYLLHTAEGTIATVHLGNREAPHHRDTSDSHTQSSDDKTPPRAKVIEMAQSVVEVAHITPSPEATPAGTPDITDKITGPALDEEDKALLRNMLSMIQ